MVAKDIIVRRTYLEKIQKINIIDEVDNFTSQTSIAKKIKRVLAVKIILYINPYIKSNKY